MHSSRRTTRPPVRLAGFARTLATGTALLTIGLAGAVTLAAPAGAANGPVTGVGESQFVSATNSARASAGKAPYVVRGDLVAVARAQAARMAAKGDIWHNPNLSTDVTNWRFVGENVGMGPSVGAIQNAFMNSTSHRDNILDGDFTEVGIGTVTNPDGEIYVAEVFRDPMNAAAASAPVSPVHTPATTTTSTPALAQVAPAPTAEALLAARLAAATRAAAHRSGTVAQAMGYADMLTGVRN